MQRLGKMVYQSPREKTVLDWIRDRGDKTLRLNYDLDENSLVFDLGGYQGQWTSDIFSMYCSTIHVFEPVVEFADAIERRFCRNEKISVHRFGLSNETGVMQISVDRDSSSLYKAGNDIRPARFVRAVDFMQERQVRTIDLMKINIEGGEYDLLEHLIECALVESIRSIQVQFHDFVPDAEKRMASIQQELEKTHTLSYRYPFVWEGWRLR